MSDNMAMKAAGAQQMPPGTAAKTTGASGAQVVPPAPGAGGKGEANGLIGTNGATATTLIGEAGRAISNLINAADPTKWSSEIRAVLTTIDGATLGPVVAQATTLGGANKAVEELADRMLVMSMLTPSQVEVQVVTTPQTPQLPGSWALHEILVRVPKSHVTGGGETRFSAAKTVFDSIRAKISIEPTTRLPNGMRVQLGVVVVHELLKLANAVMVDKSWTGAPHDKAGWINDTVGPERLRLFDPVSVAHGAYGPSVSGAVWSGAFTVSRLEFGGGARVVIQAAPYLFLITIA